MRFFKNRTEINGVCLMQGEFPKATGEIAIDRMYADNNELKVGDTLKSQRGKQTWKVTGLWLCLITAVFFRIIMIPCLIL